MLWLWKLCLACLSGSFVCSDALLLKAPLAPEVAPTNIRCTQQCCKVEAFNRSCVYEQVYLYNNDWIGAAPAETSHSFLEDYKIGAHYWSRFMDLDPASDRFRGMRGGSYPHSRKLMESVPIAHDLEDPLTCKQFQLPNETVNDTTVVPQLTPFHQGGLRFDLKMHRISNEFLSTRNVTVFNGTTILYAGGHWNWGHMALDHVFSAYSASLQLGLPEDEDFRLGQIFYPEGFSLQSIPHEWAKMFSGLGILDIGGDVRHQCTHTTICKFERIVAGSALKGLSAVDSANVPRGFLHENGLMKFRNRIFNRFQVDNGEDAQNRDATANNGKRQLRALLVQNKRKIKNIKEIAKHINQELPDINAEVVYLQKLSFTEQLRLLSGTDIYITGVGTSQMNAFLLPAGAVVIQLGHSWPQANDNIAYFDSHVLAGVEHIHKLWYPSYSPSEFMKVVTGETVYTLDHKKVMSLVEQARKLIVEKKPVDLLGDRNVYDRAWQSLVERDPRVLWARTGQVPNPGYEFVRFNGNHPQTALLKIASSCMKNSVEEILWWQGDPCCPYDPELLESVRREFNLDDTQPMLMMEQ